MANDQTGQPGAQAPAFNPDGDMEKFVASTVAAMQSSMQSGGASKGNIEDLPLIPLWKTRPASPIKGAGGSFGAGSSAAADRQYSSTGGAGSSAAADRQISEDPGGDYSSQNAAEVHWQEMSEADRMEFAASAEKAGMWKKSQGPADLFNAWVKAVSLAGKYNYMNKDDKSKWMSPFEAVTRLSIAGMADDNQDHDGFSTETTIKQFTTSELTMQARAILQQELGRNPTDSEMKAYTAAVNAAARLNPVVKTGQNTLNPDGSKSFDGVETGGVDPAEIMQGMAQDSQESADFKTAAMYLPALRQAIEGSMQLG